MQKRNTLLVHTASVLMPWKVKTEIMHVMAATVLSVVKAPLGELGLDPSTWKSVHRAKRERAVRSV